MPAGPRPSRRPKRPTRKRRLPANKSPRSRPRSPKRRPRNERASAALADKRNALAEIREQGHNLAHQLAAARARRDTVSRRLAELERLDVSLAADIAREEALKGDAARADRAAG